MEKKCTTGTEAQCEVVNERKCEIVEDEVSEDVPSKKCHVFNERKCPTSRDKSKCDETNGKTAIWFADKDGYTKDDETYYEPFTAFSGQVCSAQCMTVLEEEEGRKVQRLFSSLQIQDPPHW